MTLKTVELAHRAWDAINRRDLDAYLALMDEDVEAVPPMASIEGIYQGHDGIRRWWDSTLDAFSDFSIEVVEVRDLGGLVVAALRLRARGAESDTPVERAVWNASEYRDGKAIWWQTFYSRDEALAVGLRE